MGAIQKIHRQEPAQASCRFFIYIAYLLNRHGNSCNPCHAEKARHCLVCHAAPRGMVPDSRGCGSVRVKRRNTPCLGDCQENTTLSGGGQPPPLRKSTRLVGIMSLATGSPCLLDNKRGVITTRQELTLAPEPDLKIGTILLRNRSPFRGNFFKNGCQSTGYLPPWRKITSLWGICGLVNRLYLGFYIPSGNSQIHFEMNLAVSGTKKYVSH